jgi:hypothetical protein
MNTLFTALASVGLLAGLAQRPIAAALDVDPMPWGAQFGICGCCLTIVFFLVARVIPKMADKSAEALRAAAAEHRESVREAAEIHRVSVCESARITAEAMGELSTKITDLDKTTEGVRTEIKAGNDSQLALLRNVLHKQTPPPESP